MSPFDSVSFLRAAIRADITKTTTNNIAGHRQGHRGYRECPPFAFSYADGVAIDRGQEERLSVKDVAIEVRSSPPACAVTADPEREVGNESGSVLKEMHVFLRAGEPRTKQSTTDDGAGVLHRWENLQGGPRADEVRKQARVASLRKERGRGAVGVDIYFKGAPPQVNVASNLECKNKNGNLRATTVCRKIQQL